MNTINVLLALAAASLVVRLWATRDTQVSATSPPPPRFLAPGETVDWVCDYTPPTYREAGEVKISIRTGDKPVYFQTATVTRENAISFAHAILRAVGEAP